MKIIKWLKWLFAGRPSNFYIGFICRHCRKSWPLPFSIPVWRSQGEWNDTFRECPPGKGCQKRKWQISTFI